MSHFDYHFHTTLPDELDQKLVGFFPQPPCISAEKDSFIQDGFFPDGTPKQLRNDCIYPAYTGHYLGYPLPSTYLDISPLYRKTAAVAAMEWITKLLPLPDIQCEFRHHNAELLRVDEVAPGKPLYCCFPDTAITYTHFDSVTGVSEIRYAPIIPWPDSNSNDEAWEKGSIPYYAELQARLTLFCWTNSFDSLYGHRKGKAPDRAYIVRVTGNTPGDLTIRCVKADLHADYAVFNRVFKAFRRAYSAGKSPMDNLNRNEQMTWFEQRNEAESEAYQISDPDTYALIQRYMQVRSHRKTLEAQKDQLDNDMQCIAISLAQKTGIDKMEGKVTDGSVTYSVTHIKARTSYATVSAETVRAFFPQYSSAINTAEYPKGRVTIDTI